MRDPTFADLRLARSILLGPFNYEPWMKFKHRSERAEINGVMKKWWNSIRQAVKERDLIASPALLVADPSPSLRLAHPSQAAAFRMVVTVAGDDDESSE